MIYSIPIDLVTSQKDHHVYRLSHRYGLTTTKTSIPWERNFVVPFVVVVLFLPREKEKGYECATNYDLHWNRFFLFSRLKYHKANPYSWPQCFSLSLLTIVKLRIRLGPNPEHRLIFFRVLQIL